MRGIGRSDDAVTITANLREDLRDTWSAKAPQTAVHTCARETSSLSLFPFRFEDQAHSKASCQLL